jgi:DUF2993 family protein
MRRFFILIVVLVMLAVVVDRAAWWFAQRTIAQEIQKSEDLAERPDVSVGGFPFLTQVLRGKYKQVDATLQDPAVDGGLKIDSLDVRLRGVQVSTSDAINGRVDSVPVDSATAVVFVSFESLNAAAQQNLKNSRSEVKFRPGSAKTLAVTGTYSSSGLSAKLDLEARLVAQDGDLVVQLAPETLDGLPSALRPQVKSLVAKASRLPSLPFGFQAESATVSPTGITVQAKSSTLKLER